MLLQSAVKGKNKKYTMRDMAFVRLLGTFFKRKKKKNS